MLHTLNTIIDTINDTTDTIEYKCYETLYTVLAHCQDIVAEWVNMRFPLVEAPQPQTVEQYYTRKLVRDVTAPYPVPQGWNKIEPLQPGIDDWIVDYQTGEMRLREQ